MYNVNENTSLILICKTLSLIHILVIAVDPQLYCYCV